MLNYNGKRELAECIESLRHTNYPNLDVVVVDNGSIDGSVPHVRQEFPWVRVVSLERNYGFASAYNIAVEMVDSEYVLLLNNDITALNPDWLCHMVRLAESDPRVAAVGPKLMVASNPRLLDMVGGIVYRWMGCSPLGHGEEDRGQYDYPAREVFFVGGGALLIRTKLYRQLGGFDPSIFAYAEDLDICWRLRLIGYSVEFCPDAMLLHKGSALWRKFTSTKLRLSQENFLYCCLKNYSTLSVLREVPFVIILNLLGSLALSLMDKRGDIFVAVLKSLGGNFLRLRRIVASRIGAQNTRTVPEALILQVMGPQRLMTLGQMTSKGLGFVHDSVSR